MKNFKNFVKNLQGSILIKSNKVVDANLSANCSKMGSLGFAVEIYSATYGNAGLGQHSTGNISRVRGLELLRG